MSVHVVPVGDLIGHEDDGCVCGPDYVWADPDTGETYAVPLVVHHSLDGREQSE